MNNNKIKTGFILSLFKFFIISVVLIACSPKFNVTQPVRISAGYAKSEPDYSNLYYWAAHPDKIDFSDSLPAGLSTGKIVADVFFLHPTTFTSTKDSSNNADINNDEVNEKTDKSSILYQASVFNENSRVFAPRYRQAHIRAFILDKETAEVSFDLAYKDIKTAFQYYLDHYNHGSPIIISSHSQGTLHASRLLKEFFAGKALEKQLVCAYIIGLPVPEDNFPTIPVCKDSLSTGCFVSWRTFKSGYVPEYIKKESYKAAVVNPLTWTTSNEPASSKLNIGGVLQNFRKITPRVVSTEIHDNILWSSKPDVFGKIFLTNKNYHIGDINLFYMNIRANVKSRIHQFMKTSPYKP